MSTQTRRSPSPSQDQDFPGSPLYRLVTHSDSGRSAFPDEDLGPTLTLTFKGVPGQEQLEYVHDQPLQFVVALPNFLFQSSSLVSRLGEARSPAYNVTCIFSRLLTPAPGPVSGMPTTSDEWRVLARDVLQWLVSNAGHKDRDEWRWGINLFWIAYVGCNPLFPNCPMDPHLAWDPAIVPVAGEYMYGRFLAHVEGNPVTLETSARRRILWEDWVQLRNAWFRNGINSVEFERRISSVGA